MQITVGIQQLNAEIAEFDIDLTTTEIAIITTKVCKLIADLRECLSKIAGPNLIGFGEKTFGYSQYLVYHQNTEYFLIMMNFFGYCCEKSIAFCDTYCKSPIYAALFTFSQQMNERFQIEFLRHVCLIQSHQDHKLDYDPFCTIIEQKIIKIQQSNQLLKDDQLIIQMAVDIFLTFKKVD